MTTIDMRVNPLSLDELFQTARMEPLHIITQDGIAFVLELADDFEQEVARLGQSTAFMSFLEERSKVAGRVSLDALEERIRAAEACEQAE